jgi:hypothetical protein
MSRRDGVDPAAGTDAIPVFEQGIGLHREPELLVETAPAPLKRSPSRHPYRGVRKAAGGYSKTPSRCEHRSLACRCWSARCRSHFDAAIPQLTSISAHHELLPGSTLTAWRRAGASLSSGDRLVSRQKPVGNLI